MVNKDVDLPTVLQMHETVGKDSVGMLTAMRQHFAALGINGAVETVDKILTNMRVQDAMMKDIRGRFGALIEKKA